MSRDTHTVRRRSTSGPPLRVTLLAAVLGLGAVGFAGAQPGEVEPFADRLLVAEVGVIVDLEKALDPQDLAALRPADLVVLEDGTRRPVVGVERIVPPRPDGGAPAAGTGGPWRFTIFVDRVLSQPDTIFDGALALGQRADQMTGLGCAGIVVADRDTLRELLPCSTAPREIEKTLVDLATAAREERDEDPLRAGLPSTTHGPQDLPTIERQWDRLVAFAAVRGEGPRALLLISDGFLLPPGEVEVLAGRRRGQPAADRQRGLADVVMDGAQALSAYGWLTFAVALRDGRAEMPPPVEAEAQSWREQVEGRETRAGERRTVVDFLGITRPGSPTAELGDRLYEAYMLPRLAPLRALAEATAGGLAWHERQLADLLDGLARRWRIRYQTSEAGDGLLRRLQVRLEGEEAPLRTAGWTRSSTPDRVTEARLRRVLAGDALDPSLDASAELLAVSVADAEGETRLRIRVAPVEVASGESEGRVRVSLGSVGESGRVAFRHRIVERDPSAAGGAWETVEVLEAGERGARLVVGVEDLGREAWGAALVEPPPEGAGP